MKIFSTLKRFIKNMLGLGEEYTVQEVEDIQSTNLKAKRIYIEKRGGKDRWLHFRCPSGCGEVISINLSQKTYPNWQLIRNSNKTITISPSVNKTDGCKSHFFIQESQIKWV